MINNSYPLFGAQDSTQWRLIIAETRKLIIPPNKQSHKFIMMNRLSSRVEGGGVDSMKLSILVIRPALASTSIRLQIKW